MVQKSKTLTTLATLLALSGFTEPAHAQSAPSSTIEFPMVGIGFGQTFQLNVVSFNPCDLQLAVLDSDGTTVKVFRPGRPTFGDITFANAVSRFPRRKQLHGVVTLQPATTSPCQAQATVEVFDDLTRTDWVVTPGLIPPGPTTTPIFLGPVGLTFEQTARLNVVAHPPNRCIGTLGFVDTTGKAIVPLTPVTLAPNQAIFVDVAGFQAGTALNASRPEVIGVFTPTVTTAAPPGICIPSLEVFDRITGYTRVLIPPVPPSLPVGVPPGPSQ